MEFTKKHRMKDIPNYIVVLDFCNGKVLKIKLSKEEKEYATRCDDFEEVVDLLSDEYGFSFSNIQWMGVREITEENIEF